MKITWFMLFYGRKRDRSREVNKREFSQEKERKEKGRNRKNNLTNGRYYSCFLPPWACDHHCLSRGGNLLFLQSVSFPPCLSECEPFSTLNVILVFKDTFSSKQHSSHLFNETRCSFRERGMEWICGLEFSQKNNHSSISVTIPWKHPVYHWSRILNKKTKHIDLVVFMFH